MPAPQPTPRLSRAPDGLVWHPLLGPPGDSADLQQPLPLAGEAPTAADHGISPELKGIITGLVAALVEVLAGRRPPHQLHPWATMAVTDHVERLCVGRQQREWRLCSLRAQQPSRLRVEVTVHLVQAGRSRAAAVCLSREQQRWTITEFCITPMGET